MAIFRKTEPGLLYELSPGRDGRLLVWSPGLMKYKDCTSLADMANINSNYLEQDIDDGCWFYQLPSLVNGDNMFYNANNGRVPLWHFEANLQSLQSGVNMFKGCSLDAVSVKRIADTLPSTSTGTITLGIYYELEGDSSVAALVTKIANKGWSVETEYNLPYGFTELEYLESSGTQAIKILEEVNQDSGAIVSWEFLQIRVFSNVFAATSQNLSGINEIPYALAVPHWNGYNGNKFRAAFMSAGKTPGYNIPVTAETGKRYLSSVNYKGDRKIKLNDTIYYTIQSGDIYPGSCYNPVLFGFSYIGGDDIRAELVGRIFWAHLSRGSKITNALVPVLDPEDKPCVFDKITRKCFYNDGTGTFGYKIKRTGNEVAPATFSLRDPYYVAPSGVYARPSGENELDIVADTDMTEDVAEQEGYIWFANTGEAYEHFGITQQSEVGEVIDA